MMTQKFSMEKPKLIKIVICLLIVAIFWVMPAPAPHDNRGYSRDWCLYFYCNSAFGG